MRAAALSPLQRWGAAATCLAVLLLLAAQVLLHGPVLAIDRDLSNWCAQHRHAGLTHFMLLVSEAHEQAKVLLVTVLLAAWQAWRHHRAQVQALFLIPAAMALNVVLKMVVQRARPVFDEPLVRLVTYSFPSGHALASTVLYGTLWALWVPRLRSRALRMAATLAAVALVLLVCSSRVYLGAHYPSDVAAGVAFGLLCLFAYHRGLQRWTMP